MSEYPAPEQRRLARQIARGTRETRALARADQAAYRSVDLSDGPFKFYDEDGNIIFQIGALDDDGNYTSPDFDPTVPPTPEIPTVTPTVDGFIVDYDGTYVDDNAPDNLHRVDVHVSATPNFEKDDATLAGSFLSPDGGNVLVPFINGTASVWVALVAVTTSGVESLPSDEVEAFGGIGFMQDEFVLTTPGPQDVTLTYLPLVNSEHLYWNGLYQPASEWSRADKLVTLNDPDGYLTVDDAIRVEYAYVLLPDTLSFEFIGSSVDEDSDAHSLALPEGWQEGDLFVVSASFGTDCASTDPRIAGELTTNAARKVWWGHLDATGNPFAVTGTGPLSRSTSVMTVYRGVTVAETDQIEGMPPLAAPVVPDSQAAIVACLAVNDDTALAEVLESGTAYTGRVSHAGPPVGGGEGASYTEVGPGSTDSLTPKALGPGQMSTTTYDTATGNLYYSVTATEDCTLRIDSMSSNIAGVTTATSPVTELLGWELNTSTYRLFTELTDSPSLHGGIDDVALYMLAGETVTFHLNAFETLGEGGGAWTGPLLYTTYFTVDYPTYEAFEADVVAAYGSMDAFIVIWTDFYGPPGASGTDGEITAVVRVSPARTWADTSEGTYHVEEDTLETFETLPLGDVAADSSPVLDLTTSSRVSIVNDRARNGSQSVRSKTGSNNGFARISGGANFSEWGDGYQRRRQFDYWAYFRRAYAASPLWGTQSNYGGLHSVAEPGALDFSMVLNAARLGGTVVGETLDTMHVSMELGTTYDTIDTGVNVWDDWFRYTFIVDFINNTMTMSIDQGGPILWTYTWSTIGFTDTGQDLANVQFFADFGYQDGTTAERAAQTAADHYDWYDDIHEKQERWVPPLPGPPAVAPPPQRVVSVFDWLDTAAAGNPASEFAQAEPASTLAIYTLRLVADE